MLRQRDGTGAAPALQESARRIERTLEVVRDELGGTDPRSHDWKGLCQHVTRGSELTRTFARALNDFNSAEETDPHSMLLHVFTLRQLEIAMNLIARMGDHIDRVEQRLHESEARIFDPTMARDRGRS